MVMEECLTRDEPDAAAGESTILHSLDRGGDDVAIEAHLIDLDAVVANVREIDDENRLVVEPAERLRRARVRSKTVDCPAAGETGCSGWRGRRRPHTSRSCSRSGTRPEARRIRALLRALSPAPAALDTPRMGWTGRQPIGSTPLRT